MAGFGALINDVFQDAMALLFDTTCTVKRAGARTANGRFGYTSTLATTYSAVPCTVRHNVPDRGMYADRLNGRVLAILAMPREYTVLVDDVIQVAGGDTYQVVGPPHLDGPDDPALSIPVAAVTPAVTNP